jgi:uncharacterized membrane protein YeaQ/YmgE (transglycosylase-associated protein family)
MSIIGWLVIGALAGWIASIIMGRNDSMGWVKNILAGIVGAFVGGLVYSLITGADFTAGFNIGTLVVATLGAIVVLAVVGGVGHKA